MALSVGLVSLLALKQLSSLLGLASDGSEDLLVSELVLASGVSWFQLRRWSVGEALIGS